MKKVLVGNEIWNKYKRLSLLLDTTEKLVKVSIFYGIHRELLQI